MGQLKQLLMRIEELERRVGQIVVRGKIAEVDADKHCARVSYGDKGAQLTAWLQWKPIKAGQAKIWWCPEIGEGVTVISDGDLSLGEIFPGSYHKDFPAPSSNPDEFLIEFGDGSKISHNRSTGKLDLMNMGDVNITTQQNITVTSSGEVTVKAKKIKLNEGAGVVTGAHICMFNGLPHSDCSKTVMAEK